MTKRIVLHCGLAKTGSSALQVQFAQSRNTMIEKLGLDYIKAGTFDDEVKGMIASGNGARLAQTRLDPHHPSCLSHIRDRLEDDIVSKIRASSHDILLSSEFFGAISTVELRDLVKLLSSEGRVELIYFVRNQTQLIASSYMQRVKRHGEQDFPQRFIKNRPGVINQAKYYKRFARIREVMPSTPLKIRMYEDSADHPKGIMGLFLSTIGLDPDVNLGLSDTLVNTSPSPLELRLMLEVNRHNPRMQFSDMLVEASAEAGRSKFHSNHTILPAETRHDLKKIFDADNEVFFREFFNCENQYPIDVGADYIDLESLTFTPDDVLSILGGVMVKMDDRIAALEQAERHRNS